MFYETELSITRVHSTGFTVGVSLSGENVFVFVIGMEEQFFVLQLQSQSNGHYQINVIGIVRQYLIYADE